MQNWQTLIGAMLGVVAPIFLYMLSKIYEDWRRHREDIRIFYKLLIDATNRVLEIETAVKRFLDTKVDALLVRVRQAPATTWSIERAFLPLFSGITVTRDMLDLKVKSSFLENKLLRIGLLNSDYASSIEDSRHQFNTLVEQNQTLALARANPAAAHNQMYADNLTEYRRVVQDEIIEQNTKQYLKVLTETRFATEFILKKGFWRWRFKYRLSFKYFRTYKAFSAYKDSAFERISSDMEQLARLEYQRLLDLL